MVMRKRFQQNRPAPACLVLFDDEHATFHVVFVLGLGGHAFEGAGGKVARMVEGVGNEDVVSRFNDPVVNITT